MSTLQKVHSLAFKHVLRACVVVAAALATSHLSAQTIKGAGAPSAGGIFAAWNKSKAQSGVDVQYTNLDSEQGQQAALTRSTDFGASDIQLEARELRQHKIAQVPLAASVVAIAVNLPEAREPVRLTAPLLAEIFSGKLKAWNDPQIVAINPGLAKMAVRIRAVVYREPSAASRALAEYLTDASPEWRATKGVINKIEFLDMVSKDSVKIVDTIKQVNGAIGYVEWSTAQKAGLTLAQVKNRDGQFVAPSTEAINASLQSVRWDEAYNGTTYSFHVNLLNQAGAKSWPIMTTTYALIPRAADKKKEAALREYLLNGLRNTAATEQAGYVALPNKAVDLVASLSLR